MEAKTTIRDMMATSFISVPQYQRAYSWDEEKQVKQFLKDLDEYIKSKPKTPYYFGHFLFEHKESKSYNIIDGQQRLTTIVIFLSAVFEKLERIRELTEEEKQIKEDIIKRGSYYRFSTVDYDDSLFRDYVIDHLVIQTETFETLSSKRIVNAFDFFVKKLESKDEGSCLSYIESVTNSACTTHIVNGNSEAIQMFIFQNNRGKAPTKLEIIKAQFMYEVHVSSLNDDDKKIIIKELQNRFEHIYKSIAQIEGQIDEDDVLLYALRVFFNTLDIDGSTEKIEKELSEENSLEFVKNFTLELQNSFESLKPFFQDSNNYEIYSFALLGKTEMLPFVIKSYEYKISNSEKAKLFAELESLVLRHRIIGTRAHMEDRIKDLYAKFTKETHDIQPIIDRINWCKHTTEDWWWAYWSDKKFEEALKGALDHKIAKHILWRYENFLKKTQEPPGYSFMKMEQIEKPEVEHIAPQTPTDGSPIAAGYCEYDDDFKNHFLDCLGNYLLISKSHNCSIGNVPFEEKRNSYKAFAQQREIQEMTKDNLVWDKEKIKERQKKLMEFIIKNI